MSGLLMRPIGHIKTPFPQKNGCPRQGLVKAARARLKLSLTDAPYFLDGLEKYTHAHIIFHFHLNDARDPGLVRPKVRPPMLDGKKVGVYATRTPHRPNELGLTVARIERIEGGTIHFSGVDLVNDTPILDVKPYIPRFDSFAHAGIPEWVAEPPIKRLSVRFELLAEAQMQSLFDDCADESARSTLLDYRGRKTKLEFFETLEELRESITEVLSNDTRSATIRARHRSGRPEESQAPNFDTSLLAHYSPDEDRGTYGVCLDVLCFRCSFDTSTEPHTVRVLLIEDWRSQFNFK